MITIKRRLITRIQVILIVFCVSDLFIVNKKIMKSDIFKQVLGNVLIKNNNEIMRLQDKNFNLRK